MVAIAGWPECHMKEIHSAIPDVDALLAIQPEELAGSCCF